MRGYLYQSCMLLITRWQHLPLAFRYPQSPQRYIDKVPTNILQRWNTAHDVASFAHEL